MPDAPSVTGGPVPLEAGRGQEFSFVSDHGNPELGNSPVRPAGPVTASKLGAGRVEADLESLDFAEPAVGVGFVDAVGQISDDLDKAWPLSWVDPEHGSSGCGLNRNDLGAVRARFECGVVTLGDLWGFGSLALGRVAALLRRSAGRAALVVLLRDMWRGSDETVTALRPLARSDASGAGVPEGRPGRSRSSSR